MWPLARITPWAGFPSMGSEMNHNDGNPVAIASSTTTPPPGVTAVARFTVRVRRSWSATGALVARFAGPAPTCVHSQCDQRLSRPVGGHCARKREPCGPGGSLMAR
jgi:hypothetical protein